MKRKKFLSFILSALMALTVISVFPAEKIIVPTETVEAAAVTADQAIEWCKSKVGTTVGNGQCVGLINGYMDYLGVNHTGYLVNVAAEFRLPRFCPPNWQQIEGAQPQKGDILIYTGGYVWNGIYCGHVAIYESDSSLYEQNYNGNEYVMNNHYKYNSTSYCQYWGVLRPDFTPPAPLPEKPTVTVTAGTSTVPTVFKWNACNLAEMYDIRIFDANNECIFTEFGIRELYFSYQLPVGHYEVSIAATNATNYNWTFSDRVAFNVVEGSSFKGEGSDLSPFRIETAKQLRELSDLVNDGATAPYYRVKYYIQTADIDLENKPFIPIGTRPTADSTGGEFDGVYDGQGYKITGLNVNVPDANTAGLFGWSYGGTIKNLNVYGSVKGKINVGGIIGEIGYLGKPTVENCSFNGTVEGKQAVGGICGHFWRCGVVKNCYFNGTVTGTPSKGFGGLIGGIGAGDAGDNYVGTVIVQNCYAVSDSKPDGGIIGNVSIEVKESTINISNNFYLETMAKTGINGDYTAGTTSASAKTLKTLAETLGKPFVNNKNTKLNDGYPVFEWQVNSSENTGGNGDVNGSGSVNALDLIAMKKYIFCTGGIADKENADMDGDGDTDIFDFILLKNLLIS